MTGFEEIETNEERVKVWGILVEVCKYIALEFPLFIVEERHLSGH
jgi:hypothetical protein